MWKAGGRGALEAMRRSRSSVNDWREWGKDYNLCGEQKAMKRIGGVFRNGGMEVWRLC